ncbi:Y-family DNA polymerase [Pseudomonas mangrovi]|uniref:DNA repair nucleotidyltransferase n=1 Tax=Pseudomonas mangrovi TaxID=2161748 RepID=A0A2T5P7Z6_9PSED|nr:DNA polymerase Y family protein [Pseudomonas mangrovi]PTU73879.1 DNA repair nucleotidyltransferase [Pseudomonas mangrovi]
MRWACILFPQLALDGVLRRRSDPDEPLALLAGPPQRRMIRTANAAARALGLRPGQSLAAAQLLGVRFACEEYLESEIQAWQGFLAAWAYRFSSQVSLHYPRALLLEIESSLGLFGPWPRFEARLRAELDALGFRHRIVLAPTPAAARVLANVQDGAAVNEAELADALTRVPVARAGLSAETTTALARMGLRTLQQVFALPRDSLARRFPAELLRHLDCLTGGQPQVLDCYQPADSFEARIELNFEVESTQALLFPLRRLIGDLAAYLGGRDSGVQRFELLLEHRVGQPTQLQIGLLAAEREAGMLLELTRGRLEQLQLEAPVLALCLRARDLPPFVPQHRTLFDERPQQNLSWEQLRERLRARLGDASVQGLSSHAEHRPEQAWRAASAQRPGPLPEAPRPGWLLRTAQPLREQVRILAGPERIESGWWDGADMRRDYYLIETRSGQRGWAFAPLGEAGPLQLQGWFG